MARMPDILLQTKLFMPPIRPFRVPRPRLIEKLNNGLHGKLTLLSAPAGSGKTTLAAEWLQQKTKNGKQKTENDGNIAWLSLDESDNDPIRFLRYFVAALQRLDIDVGQTILPTAQNNPNQAIIPLLAGLLNELAAIDGKLVLVLDDYHVITEVGIHEAMIFLLDYLPPQLYLVLVSRTEPPLQLPRLRVRGELTELGIQELRFTLAETAVFFNDLMKLNLTSADITRLDEHTEGWIASLQLAAHSLQGQNDPSAYVNNFTGDNRHVMDYLVGEVLQRQPGYIRDFLLQTAVLRRLNVQLCNAVTGQVGSQHILEDLDRRNLFVIPLDDRRHWYRYHQLFAQFLQAQLKREQPELLPDLHRRASQWFVENGFIFESIDHALAAADFANAADLLMQHARQVLWEFSQATNYLQWCNLLPDGEINKRPELLLVQLWALLFTGANNTFLQKITAADLAIDEMDASPHELAAWRAELAAVQGEFALFSDDIYQALNHFETAITHLSPEHRYVRSLTRQAQGFAFRLIGCVEPALEALTEARELALATNNHVLWLFALNDLAETHVMTGDLQAANDIYNQMLAQESERPSVPAISVAHVGLGQVAWVRNELETAVTHLEKGISISKLGSYQGVERLGHTLMAYVKQAQGKDDEAVVEMETAVSAANAIPTPRIVANAKMHEARLALLQGNLGLAKKWADALPGKGVKRPSIPQYLAHLEQTLLARVSVVSRDKPALSKAEVAVAAPLIESLITEAQENSWHGNLIELYLLAALCEHKQNNTNAAQFALKHALDLAAPQEYQRQILDFGESLLPILTKIKEVTPHKDYVNSLFQKTTPSNRNESSPLLDSLTKRELEILKLMADGLSNRQIAEKLFIARGTVGKHTSNIFIKLDAQNRATAVLRAQSFDLI
ncbi:MAG: hypothetical protein DWQ04_34200 [Chloroflexi bacterium]|nr:MAG: hypothetical protein DWQ04_34200 [Chloroflexota bacterium]